MASTYGAAEDWLVGAMRGRFGAPVPHLLAAASTHRVDGLVASAVLARGDLSERDSEPWRLRLNALAAADVVRHVELVGLCRDVRLASVQPLLMKGAGLAYTHYAHSWERPHDDVDLWCTEADALVLQSILERRGYAVSPESRPAETGQIQFVREATGATHQVELHLRMLTPLVFADALALEDARRSSVAIPELDGARTLCSAHALFLACLHRVAHHFESQRLIWLYDIDLLARSLDDQDWLEVARRATRSRTRAVVRASLDESARLFGTEVPATVLGMLASDGEEPSRAFLSGQVRELDVQWSNFRHAGTWRARGAMVLRRLFPAVSYMRTRYNTESRLLLSLAYGWRILAGVPRWFLRYRQEP